jgi:hypothetical protein
LNGNTTAYIYMNHKELSPRIDATCKHLADWDRSVRGIVEKFELGYIRYCTDAIFVEYFLFEPFVHFKLMLQIMIAIFFFFSI